MVYCVMFPFWCSGGGGSHVSTTDREKTLADTKFRGDAVGTKQVSEKENVLHIHFYTSLTRSQAFPPTSF